MMKQRTSAKAAGKGITVMAKSKVHGGERDGEYEFFAEGVRFTVLAGIFENVLRGKNMEDPREEDTVSPEHSHAWVELFYVNEGELGIHFPEGEERIRPGEMLLVAPGTRHYAYETADGAERTVINFSLTVEEDTATAKQLRKFLSFSSHLRLFADKECREHLDGITQGLADGSGLTVGCRLLLLLLRAAKIAGSKPEIKEVLSDNSISRIYKLDRVFSRFYRSELPLATLAAELHLSERQLARVIRKEYGCTYRSHIIALRMKTAAALLDEGKEVAAVASYVGYRSVCGFIYAFRETYGISPAEYRKKKK